MKEKTSRGRFVLVSMFALFVSLPITAHADTAEPQLKGVVETQLNVRTKQIAVELEGMADPTTLTISDPDVLNKLKSAARSDEVVVSVDKIQGQITKLISLARPVPLEVRLIAFAVSVMALLLLASILSRGKPLSFIIGVDNRYSNSQTQLALWFGAAGAIYLAALFLRVYYLGWGFVGGVGLSEHVMELTGLSALTFGGAKAITAQKVANAQQDMATAQQQGATIHQLAAIPQKTAASRPNLINDLFTNDAGQADLGDFQMILITTLAAAIFLITCINFLGALAVQPQVTLPDVDTSLLTGFGVGQGAYLVKKAALKLGEG